MIAWDPVSLIREREAGKRPSREWREEGEGAGVDGKRPSVSDDVSNSSLHNVARSPFTVRLLFHESITSPWLEVC